MACVTMVGLESSMEHERTVQRRRHCFQLRNELIQKLKIITECLNSYGIYSSLEMRQAGFIYTGNGDTVRCNQCLLEVSQWTQDMKPLIIHSERSPECIFVRSFISGAAKSDDTESPPKRQKLEQNINGHEDPCRLTEVESLKDLRRLTFSRWPNLKKKIVIGIIEAGFFACNCGDRVICIYCNLVCENWNEERDDPIIVHTTLSKTCPYVLSMLMSPEQKLTSMEHDNPWARDSPVDVNNVVERTSDHIVDSELLNHEYMDISSRVNSFKNCPEISSLRANEFARAGFYYLNSENGVLCFCCGGSLEGWNQSQNSPLVEHARYFPHCHYIKQMYDDEQFIEDCKKYLLLHDERSNSWREGNDSRVNRLTTQMDNENLLTRFVAARLDLASSQYMLDRNFKLSVIKRCWQDQLQLNHDDFKGFSDLFLKCTILQRQIDCINGNKDNVITPSVRLKLIHERQQLGLTLSSSSESTSRDSTALNNQASSGLSAMDPKLKTEAKENSEMKLNESSAMKQLALRETIVNPCLTCFKDEKRLACIPCGHLAVCVTCGSKQRVCPRCQRSIDAFVRIYV